MTRKQSALFYSSRMNIKIRDAGQRCNLIGDWFESLFHDVLPGSKRAVNLVNDFQSGDLEVDDMLFEIKGVNNGAKPQIRVAQFEELMRNIPFPYSHLLYLVCSYKVRVRRNGVSFSQLTENTPTVQALDEFLAKKFSEAYIIHHDLLSHLNHKSNRSFVFHQDIINLRLKDLRVLAKNKEKLASIGLISTELKVGFYFRNCKVGPVKFVVIATEESTQKINKLLSRSKIKTKKENK